jgi:hypothetical protein
MKCDYTHLNHNSLVSKKKKKKKVTTNMIIMGNVDPTTFDPTLPLGNFDHHLVFGMSTFIVRNKNDVFQTR